jgi:hypothetical protein
MGEQHGAFSGGNLMTQSAVDSAGLSIIWPRAARTG